MTKIMRYDFYRPHKAVMMPTQVINPKTGKLETPVDRTKQSDLASCDINKIIKSFSMSGQVNHISANALKGMYADLPDELDYQGALNLQIEADKAFMSLPAHVRDRFGSDPAKFLAFMSDPANTEEARKLGLLKASSSPPPGGPPKEPPPAAAAADEPPPKK